MMELKDQQTSTTNLDLFSNTRSRAQLEDCCHSTCKNQGYVLNNLKSLDYSDRETITNYAEKYNQFCCEFSFSNLYLWVDIYHYEIAYFNDWLVIIDPDNDYCLMPLGENITPSGLHKLSECLHKEGYSGDISNVPPEVIAHYPELSCYYDIESYREIAEYIYASEKLYELKGKKLRKKKNHISQFKRKYPEYQVRALDAATRNGCLEMSERLLQDAENIKKVSKSIRNEMTVIRKAFDSFNAIPLEGIAIYVENRPICFSIYSRLNQNVFTIHFEKADYRYSGVSQMINWETARILKERCQYINREQDLGIPGLRKAKLSYEPELIYPANYLSLKE